MDMLKAKKIAQKVFTESLTTSTELSILELAKM